MLMHQFAAWVKHCNLLAFLGISKIFKKDFCFTRCLLTLRNDETLNYIVITEDIMQWNTQE